MILKPYTPTHKEAWNAFINTSKNGFFMFDRNYMDYHADRFDDYSLMFYDKDKLVAVLPANKEGSTLHTHQGLTFGGFITGKKMKAGMMLDAFDLLVSHLEAEGFDELSYKATPHIYHKYPAQEDLYGLFRHKAQIVRADASTAIDLKNPYPLNKGRKALISKAKKTGITVEKSDDFDTYFDILNIRLSKRYKKKSTHTAEEMRLLQSRFPKNIELHAAFQNGVMIAGVLLYLSPRVIHTQYIGATDTGLKLGATDLTISSLLKKYAGSDRYFDFGISNENSGAVLNRSLAAQKEHFGGRTIIHQFYNIRF